MIFQNAEECCELKKSGERSGSLSVEGLINCGPKQGGSGWLPMSKREANSFTCFYCTVPGARSGSVREDAEFVLQAKERELGASCRDLPRQRWLLPAVEAGEKALRPSSVGALIARVLVPRAPPPGSLQG